MDPSEERGASGSTAADGVDGRAAPQDVVWESEQLFDGLEAMFQPETPAIRADAAWLEAFDRALHEIQNGAASEYAFADHLSELEESEDAQFPEPDLLLPEMSAVEPPTEFEAPPVATSVPEVAPPEAVESAPIPPFDVPPPEWAADEIEPPPFVDEIEAPSFHQEATESGSSTVVDLPDFTNELQPEAEALDFPEFDDGSTVAVSPSSLLEGLDFGSVRPESVVDGPDFTDSAGEIDESAAVSEPTTPSQLLSRHQALGLVDDDLTGQRGVREAGGVQHLVFTLGGVEYAVALAGVLEIGAPPALTPLPHVPDWVLGVGNVRGDVLAVIDLAAFFGQSRMRAGRSGRLLVVRSGDGLTTGLLVEGVSDLCRLTDERIVPLPGPAPGSSRESFLKPHVDAPIVDDAVRPFLSGWADSGGRRLRILDLKALLSSPEMRQFEPD